LNIIALSIDDEFTMIVAHEFFDALPINVIKVTFVLDWLLIIVNFFLRKHNKASEKYWSTWHQKQPTHPLPDSPFSLLFQGSRHLVQNFSVNCLHDLKNFQRAPRLKSLMLRGKSQGEWGNYFLELPSLRRPTGLSCLASRDPLS